MSTREVLLIAAESETDVRSVRKELAAQRGEAEHVRGRAGERIRQVLAQKGLISEGKAA